MIRPIRPILLFPILILLSLGTSAALARGAGTDDDTLETLRKELERCVRVDDTWGVKSTIEKIGALGTREAMEVLLSAISLPNEEVYASIRQALITTPSEEAIGFLAEVLGGKGLGRKARRWRLRVAVAEAFGERKDEPTFDPLLGALSDKVFPVRRQVLRSLKRRGDLRAVPRVVEFLEGEEDDPGILWEDALACLRTITGQDLVRAVDWMNWWEAHGKAAPPPEKKEKPAGDDPQATRDAPAEFFGVKILSKRIVFLIDVSGSMALWDPGGEGEKPRGTSGEKGFRSSRQRIQRAKKELIQVIQGLRPQVRFNIVTFSHELRTFAPGKLIPANRANKARAIQFSQSLAAKGGTATDEALQEGFGFEEANTIILLADGVVDKPGGRNPSSEQILEMVRKRNRFRKVKIHTFGFDGEGKRPPGMRPAGRLTPGLLREFREMMQKLAEEHDGKYTSIR